MGPAEFERNRAALIAAKLQKVRLSVAALHLNKTLTAAW